ncbi:MAG: septum site-determining protein MinC [Plesiomonas sp.]
MSQHLVDLKGSNFTLTVVHPHTSDPNQLKQALSAKVQQAPAFFQGAPVVLNVADLAEQADFRRLKRVIREAGLFLVGVSGCINEKQRETVRKAGLPILTEGKAKEPKPESKPVPEAIEPEPVMSAVATKVINTPVRSGQQIYAKNCDLIVNSHVSAGAELIADGHIHIYGVMRGRAIAGADGRPDSSIFCLNMQAELLSISGQYALSDKIPKDVWQKATRVVLRDNNIHFEAL